MRILVVLLVFVVFGASAQPAGVMPIRARITPANAADVSLYMMLARRADRVLWSPGGSLLAVIDGTDIDLYSVTNWLATPLRLRLDSTLTDAVFSPDGRLLYTLTPGSIVAWNVADVTMADRYIADGRRITISPDGVYLALLSRANVVQVMNTETRETYTITPATTTLPDDIAFSSDGRRLFISDAMGGGEIVDLALRRTERVLASAAAAPTATLISSAAYSGDGRRIFSQPADDARAVLLWDARSGEQVAALNRPAEYLRVYGWGLNTRANIAAGAGIGNAPERSAVLVWPLSGGDPLARLRHPGVRDAQPSPDGTLIASVGGGTLRLWAAAESLPTQADASWLSQVNVVAACDVFGVQPSLGGVLDGQTVSLVWSWYAATPAQVRDYLDTFIVRLDLDSVTIRPWVFVTQTLPDDVNGGDPTVYLYAPVGSMARGQHLSRLEVTWVTPIRDGYSDYGPGTANTSDGGTCTFVVR